MKRGGFVAILLLVALTAVGSGCGSDSDTASTLTKAEFDKQVEVICNSYESEKEETLVKLSEQFRGTPSAKEKEEVIAAILVPYEQMTESLDELGAPAAEAQQLEEAVKALEEAAKRARANPESVFANNAPFNEANEKVEALGWEGCVA